MNTGCGNSLKWLILDPVFLMKFDKQKHLFQPVIQSNVSTDQPCRKLSFRAEQKIRGGMNTVRKRRVTSEIRGGAYYEVKTNVERNTHLHTATTANI